MKWYKGSLNNPNGYNQGLILDEETGDSIAVVFNDNNSNLIACTPELLAMLERLYTEAENQFDQSATHDGLKNCDLLRDTRSLLFKANEKE